ncbi:MAG: response regulator [Candidatus Binatia bacterium]
MTAARILIVDDVEQNRFLLEEALADLGETMCAEDGAKALEIVVAATPHVVVLDFQMPGMDGAETSRRIKADERVPFTYVLLLSGYHEADANEGIRRAGADRFLGKPYSLEEVRQAVREGLRVAIRRREASTSGGTGTPRRGR